MPHEQVTVRTQDGDCPLEVLTPPGQGPWPAVIMYMDAGGVRPGMTEVAQQLADGGFLVLLPDIFYRYGAYGPLVPAEVFKGDFRAILGPLMATTNPEKAAADAEALLAFLDARDDVAGDKVGTVGFCMGGGLALGVAGTYPDRIAVVACYHGGNLATDAPTSPHRFVPRMKADVYIAAAEKDSSYPPEMAARLEAALTEAGLPYRTDTYPAAHGWMMPDFPVFDPAAAARGWEEMLALFRRTLPQAGGDPTGN